MTPEDLQPIAVDIAKRHDLDPALVCSICAHESAGWQTWATRYEPAFYRRYIEPMQDVPTFGKVISKATERTLRATSLGLMQVMGQVAREYGFKGEYLTELCDPAVGIEYGCRRLKRALTKNGNNVPASLLEYNGGGNANYPDLVMSHYAQYAHLNSES